MDKADFIKLAPAYYELAVLALIWKNGGHLSEHSFRKEYELVRDGYHEAETLLGSNALLRQALRALEAKNVLAALEDPFGPTLYVRADGINEYIEELEANVSSPFHKSSRAPDRTEWIFNALIKLDETHSALAVTEAELEKPDDEWAPIPLDRSNPALTTAIEAVDETIKQVQQSNGYAADYPEERNFVLDNLEALAKTLKTAASTSIAYVRHHGLSVLSKLQARFGDALVGEVAKEAAKALWNFVKETAKSVLP